MALSVKETRQLENAVNSLKGVSRAIFENNAARSDALAVVSVAEMLTALIVAKGRK